MSKRYCSHCGTPNEATNQTCAKCNKPLSSGLHSFEPEHAPQKPVKASRFKRPTPTYQDHDDDWQGEIVMPSSSDLTVGSSQKLTIGALKDGAQAPSMGGFESLPADVQVSSRSYFHQETFD